MDRFGSAHGVRIDPSVRLLLDVFREPAAALRASEREWDGVVRLARMTRLLGPLGARLAAHGAPDRIARGNVTRSLVLQTSVASRSRAGATRIPSRDT